MLSAVVVLGMNLSGAFFSLLTRRLAQRLPHAQVQVSAVIFTIVYALGLPFAFFYGGVEVSHLEKWWPYILISGTAYTLNSITFFLVYRHMDAAMSTLLMTTHLVMAAAAAIYVLGESLGSNELVGALMVLGSVTYALSVHVSRRERRNWTLGIIYTIIGAVLFAVGAVLEKILLDEMGAASFMVWGWGAHWAVAVLLALVFGGRHFKKVLSWRNVPLLVGAGASRFGVALGFVMSLVLLKNLCIAVILAGLRPLFVAFLGAWLLRERKFLLRKVVASIVAAIGVAVMFW